MLTSVEFVAKAGYDKHQNRSLAIGFSLEPPFIGPYFYFLRFGMIAGLAVKAEKKQREVV